ncbi:MAG TPA: Nif3-like dinuclear metal center hexameric protein, partial [Sphingobacteriaceae bacterium]
MATFFNEAVSRRQFVAGSLLSLGVLPALAAPTRVQNELTVQQLIDLILKEIPGQVSNTVDTIKIGNANQKITGVVASMFPTIEVIRKAIELSANFLIVHEPSFYNHLDDTGWLEQDEVFRFKKSLLVKNQIAVWRFHDYIHRHEPDGVLEGVIQKLGWKKFQDQSKPYLFSLPTPSRLQTILADVKTKLAIPNVRIVGSTDDLCQRVLLLPGAWGGRNQMTQIMETKPDLVICGEVAEWETSEYIRDARAMGLKRSLVVLGHAQSEEPGLAWLVNWLQEKAPMV